MSTRHEDSQRETDYEVRQREVTYRDLNANLLLLSTIIPLMFNFVGLLLFSIFPIYLSLFTLLVSFFTLSLDNNSISYFVSNRYLSHPLTLMYTYTTFYMFLRYYTVFNTTAPLTTGYEVLYALYPLCAIMPLVSFDWDDQFFKENESDEEKPRQQFTIVRHVLKNVPKNLIEEHRDELIHCMIVSMKASNSRTCVLDKNGNVTLFLTPCENNNLLFNGEINRLNSYLTSVLTRELFKVCNFLPPSTFVSTRVIKSYRPRKVYTSAVFELGNSCVLIQNRKKRFFVTENVRGDKNSNYYKPTVSYVSNTYTNNANRVNNSYTRNEISVTTNYDVMKKLSVNDIYNPKADNSEDNKDNEPQYSFKTDVKSKDLLKNLLKELNDKYKFDKEESTDVDQEPLKNDQVVEPTSATSSENDYVPVTSSD